MSRQIRTGKIGNGLVLANGGVLSYQHAICLSSRQGRLRSDYPDSRGSSDTVVGDFVPSVDMFADGEAIVEVSWPAVFERHGDGILTFLDFADVHSRIWPQWRARDSFHRRATHSYWSSLHC